MYLKIVLASAAFMFQLVDADDCITPNNETAKCISLFNCPLLLKASSNTTAQDVINKSKCGTGFNVCCGTKSNFITNKPAKQSTPTKFLLLPLHQCGLQHSDDYFHTVNYTVFTEFPWVAVVETKYTSSGKSIAGSQTGSLISDKYVLTAAGLNIIMTGVWLGGYHPLNESQCLEDSRVHECNDPPQHFQIEETIRGAPIGLTTSFIALLRLRETVKYSDYIRPICLPLPGTIRPKIGDTLVESSSEKWKVGQSPSFGNGTKTRYYLKLNYRCDDHFANYLDVVCLPYSETNLTSQPLGGPLMFSYRAKWYQEGIAVVRWSIDPIQGIYVNVSYHLDWILYNLKP